MGGARLLGGAAGRTLWHRYRSYNSLSCLGRYANGSPGNRGRATAQRGNSADASASGSRNIAGGHGGETRFDTCTQSRYCPGAAVIRCRPGQGRRCDGAGDATPTGYSGAVVVIINEGK